MKGSEAHTHSRQKQVGYTLVELSVAVVIIGFMMTVLMELYPKMSESSAKIKSVSASEKLEQSILGFVFSTGRLPCPAADLNGVEDCTLEKGELAYRTLGFASPLRNQAGVAFRYAVFDKALTGSNDTELTALKDRYQVYIATDDNSVSVRPTAQKSILNSGAPNTLDFCKALNNAITTVDASELSTGGGTELQNVAYLIHDVGLSDASGIQGLADGRNTLTGTDLNFSSPSELRSATNDDYVYVKSFGQLWSDLECGVNSSAIGHAHPNTASASALMNQALADYKRQTELGVNVADADIALAAAAVLSGVGATAAAAATIPIATSEAINTAGAAAPVAGLAVAAVAAAAVVRTTPIGIRGVRLWRRPFSYGLQFWSTQTS